MAPPGDCERLLSGIDVVEVQGTHTAVVAAQDASPTRLLDEELLDVTAPARDALHPAASAAVIAAALQHEIDYAVSLTVTPYATERPFHSAKLPGAADGKMRTCVP
jgi:hypothetical protein